MNIPHAIDRFDQLLMRRDKVYERYAKARGLNSNSLYVLYLLRREGSLTQKQLCEAFLLPKQTVNSMVQGLVRQGLLQMEELPADKRHKALRLTDAGRALAEDVVLPVEAAEDHAMGQLTENEQEQLFRLMEKFVQNFAQTLK